MASEEKKPETETHKTLSASISSSKVESLAFGNFAFLNAELHSEVKVFLC